MIAGLERLIPVERERRASAHEVSGRGHARGGVRLGRHRAGAGPVRRHRLRARRPALAGGVRRAGHHRRLPARRRVPRSRPRRCSTWCSPGTGARPSSWRAGPRRCAVLDNVLRPLLTAHHAEVSTLAIFIGAIGGVAAFGILGLVDRPGAAQLRGGAGALRAGGPAGGRLARGAFTVECAPHGSVPDPQSAERRAARGRHRPARPGAGAGRRRQRQDARADAPHRLGDPGRGRLAAQHPRRHLHEQGGRRDARAASSSCSACRAAPCGSAPSTASPTGCCACTGARPACRRASRSSTPRTSSA